MTHIAPLPKEAITDPELKALIAEGEALGVPDDLFPRILARAPEQAVPLMRALIMSQGQGNSYATKRNDARCRRHRARAWSGPPRRSCTARLLPLSADSWPRQSETSRL